MNYKSIFAINAVAAGLFGAAFLILPDFVLSQFNAEIYVIVIYLCRFFGGTLLLLAWFLWLLKDHTNLKLQKSIATVLLGYSAAGFVLAIMGMSRSSIGVLRTNGWALLVVYGLFALMYGYLLFLAPKETRSSRASRKPKQYEPTYDEAEME